MRLDQKYARIIGVGNEWRRCDEKIIDWTSGRIPNVCKHNNCAACGTTESDRIKTYRIENLEWKYNMVGKLDVLEGDEDDQMEG